MSVNTFSNYGQPGYSGYLKYGLNNLSVAKKVILVPPGTSIADVATAILEATWKTLCKNPMATRAHPYPLAIDVKVEGGTTIFQKTALSGSIPIREEVVTLALTYNVNPILATLLAKNNFKKWDVILVDALGNILGWTPDGTKMQGLSTSSVYFGQMSFADGSKSAENLLTISFSDPTQWNRNPAMIEGNSLDWLPLQLEGTTAVKLTVSGATTGGFTVSVNAMGLALTNPQGAYPALVKADFVCLKSGQAQSLSAGTLTDNGDGTYSYAGTLGTGSYTLGLVGASAISVVAYNIECPTVATFTVS
jgi:hypothetical protein